MHLVCPPSFAALTGASLGTEVQRTALEQLEENQRLQEEQQRTIEQLLQRQQQVQQQQQKWQALEAQRKQEELLQKLRLQAEAYQRQLQAPAAQCRQQRERVRQQREDTQPESAEVQRQHHKQQHPFVPQSHRQSIGKPMQLPKQQLLPLLPLQALTPQVPLPPPLQFQCQISTVPTPQTPYRGAGWQRQRDSGNTGCCAAGEMQGALSASPAQLSAELGLPAQPGSIRKSPSGRLESPRSIPSIVGCQGMLNRLKTHCGRSGCSVVVGSQGSVPSQHATGLQGGPSVKPFSALPFAKQPLSAQRSGIHKSHSETGRFGMARLTTPPGGCKYTPEQRDREAGSNGGCVVVGLAGPPPGWHDAQLQESPSFGPSSVLPLVGPPLATKPDGTQESQSTFSGLEMPRSEPSSPGCQDAPEQVLVTACTSAKESVTSPRQWPDVPDLFCQGPGLLDKLPACYRATLAASDKHSETHAHQPSGTESDGEKPQVDTCGDGGMAEPAAASTTAAEAAPEAAVASAADAEPGFTSPEPRTFAKAQLIEAGEAKWQNTLDIVVK